MWIFSSWKYFQPYISRFCSHFGFVCGGRGLLAYFLNLKQTKQKYSKMSEQTKTFDILCQLGSSNQYEAGTQCLSNATQKSVREKKGPSVLYQKLFFAYIYASQGDNLPMLCFWDWYTQPINASTDQFCTGLRKRTAWSRERGGRGRKGKKDLRKVWRLQGCQPKRARVVIPAPWQRAHLGAEGKQETNLPGYRNSKARVQGGRARPLLALSL